MKLKVNNFLIPDRIHTAVNVDDIAIIKTTQHMEDRVSFPNIGQKLVAKSFAFAGSFDKASYINNIHSGGNHTLRLAHVGKHLQPLVRHIGRAEIRLNRAEREVGALGLSRAHAVEQS